MTSEYPPSTVKAMRLVAEPARFAAVRRAVREQLSAWGRDDLMDAAVLCATEILANVHRHVESVDCELTLDRLAGPGEGVRLAVSDGSPVLPAQAAVDWSAEGGRGLLLLAAVAERWGTVLTPEGGKQVWAVLR
jgi:hypothetical protein